MKAMNDSIGSNRAASRERGFTLVEVLVAISILAAGFGALAHLAQSAGDATRRARIASVSAILAQQKAEELYALAAVAGVSSPGAAVGSTTSDIPSYCDFLDPRGRPLAASCR